MKICAQCSLPHPPGVCREVASEFCIAAQKEAMAKLLNLVGTPGVCRGCEASVFWVRHLNGANTPYDPSGLNHFVSCPKADNFRKGLPRG